MQPTSELIKSVIHLIAGTRENGSHLMKVIEPDKDVIVMAGAGTGKTTSLVARYLANLISERGEGTDEDFAIRNGIVCVTFADKASAEMKERITKTFLKLSKENDELPWLHLLSLLDSAPISTIHSLCHRIIKQNPFIVNIDPDFEVVEDNILLDDVLNDFFDEQFIEQTDLADKILRLEKAITISSLKIFLKELYARKVFWDSYVKNTAQVSPEGLCEKWLKEIDSCKQEIAISEKELIELADVTIDVMKIYMAMVEYIRKIEDKRISASFDELITYASEIVDRGGINRRALPRWLLVDEFQDTSLIQWEFLKKFAQNSRFFLVGDSKQSIYLFRGSDPKVFDDATLTLPNKYKRSLFRNFRSTPKLIDFFNKLGFPQERENSARQSPYQNQALISDRKDNIDSRIELIIPQENEYVSSVPENVCALICEILSQEENKRLKVFDKLTGEIRPAKQSDFLVLTRTNRIIPDIVSKLNEMGINAVAISGKSSSGSKYIKILVAFLQFISNTNHNGSLFLLLTSPVFNISEKEIAFYGGPVGEDNRISLWRRITERENLPPHITNAINILRENIDYFKNGKSPARILDNFLFKNGVLSRMFNANLTDISEEQNLHLKLFVLDEVRRFYELIVRFSEKKYSLSQIIEILNQGDEFAEIKIPQPAGYHTSVRVGTIHSAKGLEAPIVVVVDFMKLLRVSGEKVFPLLSSNTISLLPKANSILREQAEKFHKATYAVLESGEANRLAYVALTRARDHLFVISRMPGRHKRLCEKESIIAGRIAEKFNVDDHKIQRVRNEGLIEEENLILRCSSNISSPERIPSSKNNVIGVQPKKPRQCITSLSAGKFAKFLLCPKFFWIENNEKIRKEKDEYEEYESKSSIAWGNAVHSVLSIFPASVSEEYAKSLYPDNPARLIEIFGKFTKTKYANAISSGKSVSEWQIYWREPQTRIIIKGRIDCGIPEKLWVWDYKTGKKNEFHQKLYERQLQIYVSMLASIWKVSPEKIRAEIVWVDEDFSSQKVDYVSIAELLRQTSEICIDDELSFPETENNLICNICSFNETCHSIKPAIL